MLMGAAEVLTGMQSELNGNVLFIFQPAEEGAPDGEEGGAELMLKEGLFRKYKPDVAFGQHVTSNLPAGVIGYRSGPLMASSDEFRITVEGRQTHGSRPWGGVDPITVAAQIILGTQTIVSRQIDITKEPAVVSFGKIEGGVRNNIIPDSVFLNGTIRNFDMDNRQQIFEKMKVTAENIAESAGAKARVEILEGYPVTANNPQLTQAVLPSLHAAAGEEKVLQIPKITGAEDFSFFANEIPGFYYFLGVTPANRDAATAPSNHSPLFYVDENALKVGTRTITQLTLDYMANHKTL
jgi:amidohydrolase